MNIGRDQAPPASLLGTIGLLESFAGFFILCVEMLGTASTNWVLVVVGSVLVLAGHVLMAAHAILTRDRGADDGTIARWPTVTSWS